MRAIKIAVALATMLPAVPAIAADYLFTVFDPTLTQSDRPFDGNTYSFTFNSSPDVGPDYDDDSFTLTGVVNYQVTFPGNPPTQYSLAPSSFTFYADPDNLGLGGLDTPLNSYFGPQLFTGPTSAPTFRTGTFALDTGSITIADATPAAAAPEPGSWALTIVGAGLAGTALRRRRVRVALG